MRSPLIPEAELRHYERMQKEQHYSYELTQKLTYFVISAELVFCGYVLLNPAQFGAIKYSSILFLMAGLAALSGVLWRFGYNQNHHDIAHESYSGKNRFILRAQLTAYWAYVVISFLFFSSLLVVGYVHISKIESVANGIGRTEAIALEQHKLKNEPTGPALSASESAVKAQGSKAEATELKTDSVPPEQESSSKSMR